MSVFIGGGPELDYPAYLVKFTLSGGTDLGGTVAFFIVNGNNQSPEFPALNGALGVSSDSGLIAAVASYLESDGWDGGSVSNVTVTKLAESSSDVTP